MKPFTNIAIVVFSLIALVHAFRIFYSWQVVVNGMVIPIWASVLGLAIAAGLALMLWRESKGS